MVNVRACLEVVDRQWVEFVGGVGPALSRRFNICRGDGAL
jgi:hypothetical protein